MKPISPDIVAFLDGLLYVVCVNSGNHAEIYAKEEIEDTVCGKL